MKPPINHSEPSVTCLTALVATLTTISRHSSSMKATSFPSGENFGFWRSARESASSGCSSIRVALGKLRASESPQCPLRSLAYTSDRLSAPKSTSASPSTVLVICFVVPYSTDVTNTLPRTVKATCLPSGDTLAEVAPFVNDRLDGRSTSSRTMSMSTSAGFTPFS